MATYMILSLQMGMNIHIYIHTYIYIHIYIHLYIYIHIYKVYLPGFPVGTKNRVSFDKVSIEHKFVAIGSSQLLLFDVFSWPCRL